MVSRSFYEQASIRVRESMASKIMSPLDKSLRDETRTLIKMTEKVPNWQTYLTEKQLEVAIVFIKLKSSTEVDYQLGLTEGTTYHRLFETPSKKTKNGGSRGALGTLKAAFNAIEKNKKVNKA